MTAVQLPTIPGKVEGIVGWDPVQLQCRDCGVIHTCKHAPGTGKLGFDILLAGFRFHICEGRTGVRRCPSCLRKVLDACPRDHSNY